MSNSKQSKITTRVKEPVEGIVEPVEGSVEPGQGIVERWYLFYIVPTLTHLISIHVLYIYKIVFQTPSITHKHDLSSRVYNSESSA